MTKEYEFMEELPNVQQAAPVNKVAESNPDTRVTKALKGNQKEPQKVEADKAIDTKTLETKPAEGKPDITEDTTIPPVDQPKEPEYAGGDQTDTRVTKPLEKGEKEPKKVEHVDAIAEPREDQLTEEQKGMEHPPVSPASPKDPEDKDDKPAKPARKTRAKKVAAEPQHVVQAKQDKVANEAPNKKLNPKLARLAKNR